MATCTGADAADAIVRTDENNSIAGRDGADVMARQHGEDIFEGELGDNTIENL